MNNQKSRQEEREMFMEMIEKLRERIGNISMMVEDLEKERDEYKYQWERCRREADEMETRLENHWREKELAKIRKQ